MNLGERVLATAERACVAFRSASADYVAAHIAHLVAYERLNPRGGRAALRDWLERLEWCENGRYGT